MKDNFSWPLGLVTLFSFSLLISMLATSFEQSAHAQNTPVQGNVWQNQATAQANEGPENILIILDSSYSMAEPVGRSGETKMAAAKRTILEVLKNVPPSTRVGLRVYGTSRSQFSACTATQSLVPLGESNRTLVASKLIGIKPTGATPISYTIERALEEDFNAVNGKKTIILVSDGIETCGEDPCNVAVRMQRKGVDVKMNVIGFGLQDYDATKQLKCVALATKGQFHSANTAAELANSLNKAMAVETKVQATIMVPKTPHLPSTFQTAPAEALQTQGPANGYVDKELPAAVPIKRK